MGRGLGLIAVLAVIILGPGATAANAADLPSVQMQLESQAGGANDPAWTDCSGGTRTWTTTSDIEVDSTVADRVTFADTSITAGYRMPDGTTADGIAVTVTDDDGFVAGASIDGYQTRFFDPTISVDLPCDPADPVTAWTVATVKLDGNTKTFGSQAGEDFPDNTFTYAALDFSEGTPTHITRSSCENGTRTFDAHVTETATNNSIGPQSVTVGSVNWSVVRYDSDFNETVTHDVQVQDDGGLVPGVTVANGDTATWTPHLVATAPCDPDPYEAYLALEVKDTDVLGHPGDVWPLITSFGVNYVNIDMTANATSESSCSNGQRTWDVGADLSLFNGSPSESYTLTDATYTAIWEDQNGNQTTVPVEVVDDGGYTAGLSLDPGDRPEYTPTLRVTLPCGPDPASTGVRVDSTFEGSLGSTGTIPTAATFERIEISLRDAGASTATPGPCDNGQNAWDVSPRFTLTNQSSVSDPITISDTGYLLEVDGQTVSNAVRVVDDGGFVSGITLNQGDDLTVTPHLKVTLPCEPDPRTAILVPRVTTDGGFVFTGQEPIIAGPIVVPVGTIGLLGLAALLGFGFWLVQRRSRRRDLGR